MSPNQRQLFLNQRFRIAFLLYIFFSVFIVFLFLGWEVLLEYWITLQNNPEASVQSMRGFPMAVKLTLLLLWGVFSFLVAYTLLDAKFLGVFGRMDQAFMDMQNDDSLTLHFRTKDPFSYLAESFNEMKSMFLRRIQRRRTLLKKLSEDIQNLPADASKDEVQGIIDSIDKELSH